MIDDPDRCYRVMRSRDVRFDGWFIVGVTSTGIYCRPSCPATTPKRTNVRFYPTAAAAQGAGFRSCKRCRPDATPGSPEWDQRADLVARAMRLIADGLVDREGVAGLANRLSYSVRQLQRQLVAEVGAGPLALARAQRAQNARLLIETTDLPFAQVAFAAGFASIRQFNDTVREVFAVSPTEMRRTVPSGRTAPLTPGTVSVRLAYRQPFAGRELLAFLNARAVAGVEEATPDGYRRALDLPHAPGTVTLVPAEGHVRATLRLNDLRDLGSAVTRSRRLLDLDADPVAIDDHLGRDPLLGPLVARTPGLRTPGAVDGNELAVRAVLGQQVSVSGARTLAGRLVTGLGRSLPATEGGLTHLFPTVAALADVDPATLPMPTARRRALAGLARALADGSIVLDAGADRDEAVKRLLDLPGIGPWTASYIAMRALGDPDAFLPSDLGARRGLEHLGERGDPHRAAELAEPWRPWRASATMHLWSVNP